MRARGWLPAFALLIGCSSSSSAPGANLSNFTGAAWSAAIATTGICADSGASATEPASLSFVFSVSGSSGLTYTTPNGCVFDFTVSGDTATLSNGPVMCGRTTDDGAAVVAAFSSYTVSTSDGQHLTGTGNWTAVEGGINCTFVDSISATR